MESLRILLISVITAASFLGGGCSYLGKNRCLASRLEHLPCQYRLPKITSKPGQNELGEYFTKYVSGRCDILRRRHRVKSIPQVSSYGGSVFYLYSPGKRYRQPTNYSNQKLVYYNVQCPSGQYIYFQLLDMTIEETMCYDHTVGRSKCVDYVQVRSPRGDIISDNCGNDRSNLDGVILPFNSIKVIFRSSIVSTYPGFTAVAQCFSPIKPSSLRCQFPTTRTKKCQESGYEKIEIPYGHELTIQDSTTYSQLTIRDRLTNTMMKRFTKPSFSSLDFHRMDGTLEHFEKTTRLPLDKNTPNLEERISRQNEFYISQSSLSLPSSYKGPGILYIPRSNNGKACFQDYLVDVSKYVPTQSEKEMIRQFSASLNKLIPLEEPPTDEDLLDQVDLLPDITLPFEPDVIYIDRVVKPANLYRQKRFSGTSRGISSIRQSTLLSAIKNDGACNPVLKGSASILSKALQKENPSQFRNFKERTLQE